MNALNHPQKSHSSFGTIKKAQRWANQNTHCGGNKSVSDNNNRDGLRRRKKDRDDYVFRRSENVAECGEFMRTSKSATRSSTVCSSV